MRKSAALSALLTGIFISLPAAAQTPAGTVLEETVAPGRNYDNYELVAWKPERVVAFVVNKGNIYYTALAPKAARSVPGILFTGGKDLEFRTNTITGRRAERRPCRRAIARRGAGPV